MNRTNLQQMTDLHLRATLRNRSLALGSRANMRDLPSITRAFSFPELDSASLRRWSFTSCVSKRLSCKYLETHNGPRHQYLLVSSTQKILGNNSVVFYLKRFVVDNDDVHFRGELSWGNPNVNGRLLFVASEHPHFDASTPQGGYALRDPLHWFSYVRSTGGHFDLTSCSLSSTAVAPSRHRFYNNNWSIIV